MGYSGKLFQGCASRPKTTVPWPRSANAFRDARKRWLRSATAVRGERLFGLVASDRNGQDKPELKLPRSVKTTVWQFEA